jgi:hypothetical protein
MTRVFSWVTNAIGFLIVALGIALALNALTYINFDAQYGFLKLKQQAVATGWYLPAYYSHVLISSLILLSGFFQLSTVGRKWPRVHRWLGYLYVMGILFFAAPGGLVMSLFINRGPIVLSSFFIQGTLWFVFTAIAFNRIRQHDIDAHREWMWRSFALTSAAITLRIYIFICSYYTDLSQPTAYAILSWMSWVPNLLFVELWLRSNRKKNSITLQ